ncbi:MAG: TlpA family protein disulfide reductase [Bacteroidales bacterium]|jgi:thiol-disulfide isomerase/thioredoxin|nr:TlpA family protein disulfide reductase [Bacteroidales bacterium]
MKLKLALLFLTFSVFFSCSKTTKVIVEIPELNEGKISIVYASATNSQEEGQSVLYNSTFNNGEIKIDLDSISLGKDIVECAMVITSLDNSFFINVPLPLEKNNTTKVKISNVNGYKKGEKIRADYTGSKHLEAFSVFWRKIQDEIEIFSKTSRDKMNDEYEKFVSIYREYLDVYPQSAFPYILLISQISEMPLNAENPLLDYSNSLCADTISNPWKDVFCIMISDKKLAKQTSKKLVFKGVDINNRTITESNVTGRLLLIDFWATWCKPCLNEIPHIKQLHNRYKSKGLTVIGISIDRTKDEWAEFIKKNPMPYISLYGDGATLTKRYAFNYIPYNLLVDENGNVLKTNLHGEELDSFVKEFLEK